MAFTTINLTESVSKDELQAYGAKPGQMDNFPTGIAVFGVNKGTTPIAAGVTHINAAGELGGGSGIRVTTIADCPAGDGIYGVAMGILPDGSGIVTWHVA